MTGGKSCIFRWPVAIDQLDVIPEYRLGLHHMRDGQSFTSGEDFLKLTQSFRCGLNPSIKQSCGQPSRRHRLTLHPLTEFLQIKQ
jgi:hypothetical protein